MGRTLDFGHARRRFGTPRAVVPLVTSSSNDEPQPAPGESGIPLEFSAPRPLGTSPRVPALGFARPQPMPYALMEMVFISMREIETWPFAPPFAPHWH